MARPGRSRRLGLGPWRLPRAASIANRSGKPRKGASPNGGKEGRERACTDGEGRRAWLRKGGLPFFAASCSRCPGLLSSRKGARFQEERGTYHGVLLQIEGHCDSLQVRSSARGDRSNFRSGAR